MKESNNKGFSLIEVLAAVAIIGIITFLALPNIVTLKQDAEVDLAIARADQQRKDERACTNLGHSKPCVCGPSPIYSQLYHN